MGVRHTDLVTASDAMTKSSDLLRMEGIYFAKVDAEAGMQYRLDQSVRVQVDWIAVPTVFVPSPG